MAWELEPECVPILVGHDGLRLEQWLAAGQAQVVKHGAHRIVYRVDLPDRAFYVKHYQSPHFARASRNLVRASASRREWRKVREMAKREISTIRPLAVCERSERVLVRDSYFVSEALTDSYPLDEFLASHLPRWPNETQAQILRQIAQEGARLCARLHRAGVWHNDLHAGNILLHVESSAPDTSRAEVRLALIDVPGVRFSGPLKWRRSRANLASLEAGLCKWFPLSLRWQFLKIYTSARDDITMPSISQAAIEIKRAAINHSHRVLRSRDRRCLRNNRDFRRLETSHGRVYSFCGIAAAHLTALADHPERLYRDGFRRRADEENDRDMVETTLDVSGVKTQVLLTRYRYTNWFEALLGRFRRSRALVAWQRGHALLARGIETPRPLAMSEPRGRWFARDSYLATQRIAGAVELHEYARQLASKTTLLRAQRIRQLAQSVGALMGRMHAAGLSLRHLNVDRLLVVERPEGVDVSVADVGGLPFRRRDSRTIRSRDLARLTTATNALHWLSRTARARLLKSYLAQFPLESRDWKRAWRQIAS